jgi:DNA-binding NtrC family response regulator
LKLNLIGIMETILVADDDKSILDSIELLLLQDGFNVIKANNGEQALQLFKNQKVSCIVTDLKMPLIDGFSLLKYIKDRKYLTPVVVVTAFDDIDSTIKAMQLGAYDYIEKPIDSDKFLKVIRHAIRTTELSKNFNISIEKNECSVLTQKKVIGKSPNMKEIYKKIGQLCNNTVTVLIQGESGSGKELIAYTIHNSGITKGKPFIPINCTALTETLLESELFGHVKGSFTGAIKDKKGKFELAGEGTILLDEISEISPDLQVKLLRVLEEKEFEPVGSEGKIKINARIITATNKNLRMLVEKGKFREDLFYRLNVVTIEVPPLRKRKEDIPLLVIEFLKRISAELHKEVRKIPLEVMEILQNHSWTGNVRELYNTLLQGVVLSKGDVLEKENLLIKGMSHTTENPSRDDFFDVNMTLNELESIHIKKMLDEIDWNKQKACKYLGITKPTLLHKIKKYHISPKV